jgi:hypothetical protein
MAYVTDHLNQPIHIYEFMNNAVAGGQFVASVTGASRATGGFAVATSSDNGRCTATWNAYSGTPIVAANAIGTGTGALTLSVVIPAAIGPSSGAFVCGAIDSSGGTATGAYSVNVLMFGDRTGTGIS